jgi:hypothetical protein
MCRQLLTFISRISFSAASIHLNRGLAIIFLPFYSDIFLTNLPVCILARCPFHSSLFLFNVCYYVSLCGSRNSWLVTLLHILCTTGPCILFSLFLSHVFSLFISASVTGHAALSTLELVSPSYIFSV